MNISSLYSHKMFFFHHGFGQNPQPNPGIGTTEALGFKHHSCIFSTNQDHQWLILPFFFLSSSISVYLHKFSLYIRYLYHLSSYITYHFITIYREDIAYKVISSITISSIRSAYIVITILPISSYNHPIYPYLSQKPWQPQHHWAPLRHWSAALLLSRSGFKPRGWNMGKWGDTLW